jgi:molybdopterin/thiamine biosynthesis adenylyltransferase
VSRFASQLVLWGRVGQDILKKSTVAILGCGPLGFEVAKTAAILGIGRLVLIDEGIQPKRAYYLDIPQEIGSRRAHGVARAVSVLTPYTGIDTLVTQVSARHLSIVRPDMVIDTATEGMDSSTVYSTAYDWCKHSSIPYFSLGSHGRVAVLDQIPLHVHNASGKSGVAMAGSSCADGILHNILAGMVMDVCKDALFRGNIDAFSGLRYHERGALHDVQEIIASTCLPVFPLHYALGARIDKQRTTPRLGEASPLDDAILCQQRVLVVGGGSIGTHLVDILARLDLQQLDIMDDDRYEERNLNRQPLGYDALGRYKAEALSEKVKRISEGRVSSTAWVGKAMASSAKNTVRDAGNAGGLSVFDHAWFEQHPYDLILGGLDDHVGRLFLNEVAVVNRRNYIDAGSSRDSARVSTYVPGKTSCQDCSLFLRSRLTPSSQEHDHAMDTAAATTESLRGIINRKGCIYQEGSIVMSNQIAAGLAASQACAVCNDQDVQANVWYYTTSPTRFAASDQPACDCSQ